MPLTVARANALTEAMNAAFEAIGTSGATAMPKSKKNTEPTAWDVFVAKHLKRLADAREKKAVRDAVKLQVMFDPEEQPLPQGTNALVFAGELVEIAVAVGTPATRVDLDGLYTDLVQKARVKPDQLKKLVAANTVENRAPHKFTASLVTV